MKQRAIVFASGTKTDGGSGFEKLFEYGKNTGSNFEVVAVVSDHERGGVYGRAARLNVPFEYFPAPWTAEKYQRICRAHDAKWALLSGWNRFVVGLEPARTVNIHPALRSALNGRFCGLGCFGSKVHGMVFEALQAGELGGNPKSGFTMHFVVDGGGDKKLGYDAGPVIAEVDIPLTADMTAKEIGAAVRKAEHMWQPLYCDMVISGQIRLEGDTVITPATSRSRLQRTSNEHQFLLPFS
jgi:folate-dependent phosphoribosylglycinamide formyltransferase PurN